MSTGFLTGLQNRVKNASGATLGQFNNSSFVRGSKDFLNSNSLVAKIVFLILVVIVFILLIRWGSHLITWFLAPSKNPKLISGMKQGYIAKVVPQDPAIAGALPVMRSSNQRDGLEFTYTVWLFINHLQNTSTKKHIFHKGSSHNGSSSDSSFKPNNGPGLYIHPTRNTLIVAMDTFDRGNEEVEINDIPMNKWINVAIRVEGNKMDVYINGTIALRHIFESVPKQNYGDVYVNMNSGFNGLLSDLWYHDYALSGTQIEQIVEAGPDMTMDDTTSVFPHYLSLNWFFQNDEAPSSGPNAATWPTIIKQ
jgi:hypothetical protein|tara:strand:- start:1017 stop:1940 length:924 start_codon:yes stop_codon:yes gene_type:complete